MAQEQRVRRLAGRHGYRVSKARGPQHMNNRGLFCLVDDRNYVVLGRDYDASLDEIEAYLQGRR
jgi:hypothetical protein